MGFVFETSFPNTKEGLINVVLLDRRGIFAIVEECSKTLELSGFDLLSEEEKAIIKKFHISEDGEVSIELHDGIKAMEKLTKLGVCLQ